MAREKQPAQARPAFEALYAALEEKARRLEQGNLPLEESLALYEQGVALAGQLREILDGAESRVRMLRVKVEEDEVQLREVESGYSADGGPPGFPALDDDDEPRDNDIEVGGEDGYGSEREG